VSQERPTAPPEAPDADRTAVRPLAARLRERIERDGPLTFRDWMEAALYDEHGGYYRRRDLARWGRAGDYRTSPERSPLFAATFARYFAKLFEELGRPPAFHLIEAGGGAGHFAHGVLRTLERDAPEAFGALRYVFDEASEDARRRATRLLGPYAARVEFRPVGELETPPEACVVFSNELLDALPVHRVRARGGRLRELFVGAGEGGGFVWAEGEPSTPLLTEHFERLGVRLAEGQEAEVCLDADGWVARAARAVRRGFLVTVDYGAEAAELYGAPHRRGGTLRAFSGHDFAEDVLARPGEQDITTTVNWTQVREAGGRAGLRTVSLERQDAFLLRAGLIEQLELESRFARGEAELAQLRLGAREMILPGGMASHFQVLVQERVKNLDLNQP
jgi:SAM-dependent MidA family methyltransferase